MAAAETILSDRYREFLAGRGTPSFLLASVEQCYRVGLALQTDPGGRTAACEEFWRRAHEIERISEARYEAGKVGIGELSNSKLLMFTAQPAWLQARVQASEDRGAAQVLMASDEDTVKQFSRDRRAALSADPSRIAQERFAAAEEFVDSRFKEMFAGRGSLTNVLQGSARRAQAKEGVAVTPHERLAAWDRHWQRMWHTEQMMQARYDKGHIAIQELLESREYQLKAELNWLQMRDAVERK